MTGVALFAAFVVLRGVGFGVAIAAMPPTAQAHIADVTTDEADQRPGYPRCGLVGRPGAAHAGLMMRFQVLGPVLIGHDHGVRPVPGGKVRTVLASLLLHAGRQVSVGQLVERMWHDDPPRMPRQTVQTTIARLRRELPRREELVNGPAGYALRVGPDELDLHVFDRLLAEAGAATDPARERRLLRDALRLWRGPVCADVESPVLREVDLPAVEERRLLALERRIELDLLLHRADGVAAELRQLTAEHPYRERLWVQLMAALHRQDRQAEALETYGRVSRCLIDELGIEPGAELQAIHRQILRGGAHPLLSPPARTALSGMRPAACGLPAAVPGFAGRATQIAALDAALTGDHGDTAAIVVLDGPAGIGKSALAIRWLHIGRDAFPDGRLYADLQGSSPDEPPLDPEAALGVLLDSLGVAAADLPAGVPARGRLFRSLTAGRRLAVLLDNALDVRQVRPLLPGPGGAVLVTSRNQMRDLVVREQAGRITVPRLDPGDALTVLGADTLRDGADLAAARTIVELCDRTPLTLRVVAERMSRQPHVPWTGWAARLRREALPAAVVPSTAMVALRETGANRRRT